MGRQIGYFFLYIGLVVSMISIAAFYEKTPSFLLCLVGVILLVLAIGMILRFRPEPSEADRFRSVKKLASKRKKLDG